MPVTLLLPGALLPREVVGALREPLGASALAALLQRAELVGDSEATAPAHLAWLGETLFHRPSPLPTAPYAFAAASGREPDAAEVIWHADPVHLELARDHLVVTALAEPVSNAEADALLATANALAAELDATFLPTREGWFLRAPRAWRLTAPPLAAALGRPLHAVMPEGDDAARWNRLLTEIQMAWHTHPVNEGREARGRSTVNSLWLHGGGAWSVLPRPPFTAVHAESPAWRGAALAAGIAAATTETPARDGALVVADDLSAPGAGADWDGWLRALEAMAPRLRALSQSSALDIVLCGETTLRRLRTHPRDRLRFWRSTRLEEIVAA